MVSTARFDSRWSALSFGVLMLMFNVFAISRAMPINTYRRINDEHLFGNYDRRVTRIYDRAKKRTTQPFAEVRDHGLFHDRNPGMFMLIAELWIRAGVRTPTPMQLVSVLMFNVGLLFMFGFLRVTFGRDGPALFGVAFMLTTPFLLYHSSSLHHEPYAFLGVQGCLYAFARYLRDGRSQRMLFLACATYFVACLNYWMYYVSTYLLLLALAWRAGQLRVRLAVVLSLPPLLGAVTTLLQAVYNRGLGPGLFAVAEMAVARSGDWRLEGSNWNTKRVFVDEAVMARYPQIVLHRVRGMMGYPLGALASALGLAAVLLARRGRPWAWLLVVGLAALSWNLIMVQHTVIHEFTGMFGHAGWMIAVCALFAELLVRADTDAKGAFSRWGARVLEPWGRRALVAGSIACLCWGLSQHYLPNARLYVRSLARHGVGQTPARPWQW
ncbi:MAG: hypothetical protein OXU20_04455 [Myxococcales bacterium]|nr:hypothetical protein [Myxococcales bacterium]MDD9970751.1 hypothetical protein [Myxococcales bacterium]